MTDPSSPSPSQNYLSKVFGLDGQSALVTGAAGGLGAGIARAMAAAGARVTLLDLNQDQAQTIADEINQNGGTADAAGINLNDLAAVKKWIGEAEPVNILVNCAGVNRMKSVLDVTEDDYELIMGLNTKALYFVSQFFAQMLIERKAPGSIINISSQMGQVGGPVRSVYCASKHAVEGLTKAMALELGPHQIRVNSICPTFVQTELAKAFLADPDFKKDVEKRICLGRLGEVEDVANAAIYLASPAASIVTGAALKVDGGWTAA